MFQLHFVHYDPSYGSVNEALAHGDGLAVIGVIFEVSLSILLCSLNF